ncbi:hypothetical protein [Natrialbaceae archaeon AArc-T1-2]|uniref:hypothetical protein n=1 Tax=Natrialbaceae archaeon AArc-T1-2 TaxID=3053904 RepID=UPI00255B18FC|nr:hypothetical protein [Natrialbaceae archaeon AArc-T1-2]WIV68366.1 hypothetical protein QQ977_06495 [Natrialbaceae archaeon AArc-T1-2]
MGWQCRLYGHQWRHPDEHAVIVTDERPPSYPFRCAVCDTEMVLDVEGNRRPDVSLPSVDEPELEADVEPIDESTSDLEPATGSDLEDE